MGLVVYDSYIKCSLLKTNGKYADQAERKEAQSGQNLSTTSFLLMTRILCVAGRRVPLDETIISVLVHNESTRRYN